ncbi:hypothetical protein HELRODRAFT_189604 [Helobdella robusta]|uniref:Uncharacterized protein n=1 Tax=Helobdella robusta TaxID=6412 RepID=T1FR70_HELRO|nr:hypothetical protein HELRODRAFT_189604 [Helobdella robusta]ESN92756.1 hypothetical protein HELRODRAFT_189604 [Helobdella robusta]
MEGIYRKLNDRVAGPTVCYNSSVGEPSITDNLDVSALVDSSINSDDVVDKISNNANNNNNISNDVLNANVIKINVNNINQEKSELTPSAAHNENRDNNTTSDCVGDNNSDEVKHKQNNNNDKISNNTLDIFSSITDSRLNRMRRRYDSSGVDDEAFFKAKLLSSLDELTVIGIKQVTDTNRSILNRILWLLLIVSSVILASWQIHSCFMKYSLYPTYTDLNFVSSQDIQFPQVTICNNNYIKLSSAEELGLTDYFKQFMAPYELDAKNETLKNFILPNSSNQEGLISTMKHLSPGLEQLVSCYWNGENCSDEIKGTVFTDAGHCITINTSMDKLTCGLISNLFDATRRDGVIVKVCGIVDAVSGFECEEVSAYHMQRTTKKMHAKQDELKSVRIKLNKYK